MCEPFHSTVQYHIDDDPTSQGGGSTESRLQWGLGKIYDWGKRIRSWFHFSSLGSGHTESIQWARTKELYLPREARYECAWWNRQVVFDTGKIHGDTSDALDAAREYSNVVCIGNIQKFRRFFEVSIDNTKQHREYFALFLDRMLTYEGRDKAYAEMQRCFGKYFKISTMSNSLVQPIKKLLLGYTRKRSLLVPEWSDCPELWVKG